MKVREIALTEHLQGVKLGQEGVVKAGTVVDGTRVEKEGAIVVVTDTLQPQNLQPLESVSQTILVSVPHAHICTAEQPVAVVVGIAEV